MRNILFKLGFSLHPWFTPIRTSPSSTAGSQGNGVYCNCGQVMSTFSPETAKVYLVEFQFKGERCEQHVFDVTDPAQRVLVDGAGSEVKAG